MKVFILYAHPEPQSLNGALFRFTQEHLRAQGHDVRVSDLHAMGWKATLDAADFAHVEPGARFDVQKDARRAYDAHSQAADVAAEQEKLRWADVVIVQFPMWWFSMPAILKGWFDRVYANGFAYGVGEHSDKRWGERYGDGAMSGKRAMVLVTTGGWEPHYGPRGINGPLDDVLFPIQHGLLFYPGFSVLPPFPVFRSGKVDGAAFERIKTELAARLDTLATTAPIPFRRQNHGDYEIPAMTLRADLAPGEVGFGVHRG